MIKHFSAILLVVMVNLTLLVGNGFAQDEQLKKLEGSWTIVSMERSGKALPLENVEKAKLKIFIKGNTLFQLKDGKVVSEAKIKLDSSKTPKHIDTIYEKVVEKGIYKLEENKLTICTGYKAKAERPTEFKTSSDKEHAKIVCIRK